MSIYANLMMSSGGHKSTPRIMFFTKSITHINQYYLNMRIIILCRKTTNSKYAYLEQEHHPSIQILQGSQFPHKYWSLIQLTLYVLSQAPCFLFWFSPEENIFCQWWRPSDGTCHFWNHKIGVASNLASWKHWNFLFMMS